MARKHEPEDVPLLRRCRRLSVGGGGDNCGSYALRVGVSVCTLFVFCAAPLGHKEAAL